MLAIMYLFINVIDIHCQQTKQVTRIRQALTGNWAAQLQPSQRVEPVTVDSVWLRRDQKQIGIIWSKSYGYLAVREDLVYRTDSLVKRHLPRRFKRYQFWQLTYNQPIENLIPNFYRKNSAIDTTRFAHNSIDPTPWVTRTDAYPFSQGLANQIIALWPGHGRYYNASQNRWEWQRPRLFGTVEDLLPMTLTTNYLMPMLENAGAQVVVPRERDYQPNEVIVDADGSTGSSEMIVKGFEQKAWRQGGFAMHDSIKPGVNPFQSDSYIELPCSNTQHSEIQYLPEIPESSDYAVYVSYASVANGCNNACYTVYHSGGKTVFTVNQQVGGSTWVYLGNFHFIKGLNSDLGKIVLNAPKSFSGSLTADAIRLGGGMGNVCRGTNNLSMSGLPRCLEGARYALQYAGMPDSLVFDFKNNTNDYVDDYTCRAEWVNYLMGNPNGPQRNRKAGMGISINAVLSLHTDAGTLANDSVVGTLAIFSTNKDSTAFPSGQSKMANRDLADIIQSQLVSDLRQTVKPDWTRRGLWDKPYAEAWRPNAPAMLLEMLSHQNATDMQYALDPRYQYIAARAIYKGLAKFMAFQQHRPVVIQPLPISHFAIQLLNNKTIRLSWKPVADKLEPSANPQFYKLYTSTGEGGFDNGQIVNDTTIDVELPEFSTQYNFKVTALNEGGESFPSEMLTAGVVEGCRKPALIVNAYDRICAPVILKTKEVTGLAPWEDKGVQRGYSYLETGNQYDYNPTHEWRDNANPGCGASFGNREGQLSRGNSFDFTITHGDALLANNQSFVSMSDEAFEIAGADTAHYQMIDYLAGKEKTTPALNAKDAPEFTLYTLKMRQRLTTYLSQGGKLFLSGSYVTSDEVIQTDSLARQFLSQQLHIKPLGTHASLTSQIEATSFCNAIIFNNIQYNNQLSTHFYEVEAPDTFTPLGKTACTVLRYNDTKYPAAVISKDGASTVVMGFPFETIINRDERIALLASILRFFE